MIALPVCQEALTDVADQLAGLEGDTSKRCVGGGGGVIWEVNFEQLLRMGAEAYTPVVRVGDMRSLVKGGHMF